MFFLTPYCTWYPAAFETALIWYLKAFFLAFALYNVVGMANAQAAGDVLVEM